MRMAYIQEVLNPERKTEDRQLLFSLLARLEDQPSLQDWAKTQLDQNQEKIDEVRASLEETRVKKAASKTALDEAQQRLAVLDASLSAAEAQQQRNISELREEMTAQASEVARLEETLEETQNKETALGIDIGDPIIKAKVSAAEPNPKPKPATRTSGRSKAVILEREGFEAILDGKYERALAAFHEAEAEYPTFHQAYEIERALKKNLEDLQNPTTREAARRRLLRTIVYELNWMAPSDLLTRMRLELEKTER